MNDTPALSPQFSMARLGYVRILIGVALIMVELSTPGQGLTPAAPNVAWSIGYNAWAIAIYLGSAWLVFSGIQKGFVKVQPPPSNPSPPQFTDDQLIAMRGLISEKLESLEQQRQGIINKGAQEGVTISTELVLSHLEAAKAARKDPGRAEYIAAADKLAAEFRVKYGDQIPVEEAYRLMKEWE